MMSWASLIPPLLVFLLGFATKKIRSSLFIGVLAAAFIATNFNFMDALAIVGNRLWDNTGLWALSSVETFPLAKNFFIVAFVLFLGILIEMIRQSNAVSAFVAFAKNSIRDKKAAETASLILSHCLSIDDYLSSLTVGSVMRPITDKFRIPRVKLAFLTDSMAAPLAMLTPVSSWAAAIIGFLTENGVAMVHQDGVLLLANPYSVYLNILPYLFYSITLVLSVWMIVRWGITFGTMNAHEQIAEQTNNVCGGKECPLKVQDEERGSKGKSSTMLDFMMPIGSLLFATFFFLLYLGGYHLLGGENSLLDTVQISPISQVLFSAGFSSFALSAAYYIATRKFSLFELLKVCYNGIILMLPVSIILILAWTLGGLLREDLRTGEWLASLLADAVPITFLPLILFWNATLISLALGSSWATAAILFPIAIPMVMSLVNVEAPAQMEQLPILFPIFGAILSGAVCGDHISLISDTTIMATTSSACDYLDHVKTQWIYSIPIFLGSSVGYVACGFLLDSSPWISLSVSLLLSIGISIATLAILHLIKKRALKSAETISN